jgi:large repetitive protein
VFALTVAACTDGTDGEKLDPNGLTPSGAGTAGAVAGGNTSAGSSGASSGAGTGELGGASSAGMAGTSNAGSGSAGAGGDAGATAGGGGSASAGSAGTAGSGGMPSATYRYVRLVATSELAGHVWSSVAELQVTTTAGALIERSGWTATADSEELDDQQAPAAAAIDGDMTTFWHSSWEPAPDDVDDAKLPHSLTIDLGAAYSIAGFSYLPRQDGANGRIGDWEFYVSQDGQAWGDALKSGTFPAGAAATAVSF